MLRFRRIACLQKFASVHSIVHNYFSSQRYLVDRTTYKTLRSAALAEWRSIISLTAIINDPTPPIGDLCELV